jgi:hypothetical protein
MTDIICPVCNRDNWPCMKCGSTGTIPDRRKPTPNDRAVERIKAHCTPHGGECWGPFEEGQEDIAKRVLNIINEETSRG